VTIAASNRLGRGKENKTVIGMHENLSNFSVVDVDFIAATNKYVNLTTSSKRIICESSNVLSSCSASYGECGTQKRWKTISENTTGSLTVVNIDLVSDDVMREYCYKVTATLDKLTVIMCGKHNYSSAGELLNLIFSSFSHTMIEALFE
jgi:hypothetical protein